MANIDLNPACDSVKAFLTIEEIINSKSLTQMDVLKRIQKEIEDITSFIALLNTKETDIDFTTHADLLKEVAKLLPLALKNGTPGHFDEHALVEKIKEADGKYDTLIQCARDQINNKNMAMGPETAQLDNLLKVLKEIGDIMGRIINSYTESGKVLTRNQRA